MPNPFEYVVTQPEMLFYYAAVALALAAWVFISYRKLFKWLGSIADARGRWDLFLLPPDDLTWEIAGVFAVVAANLFLAGLFLYVVV